MLTSHSFQIQVLPQIYVLFFNLKCPTDSIVLLKHLKVRGHPLKHDEPTLSYTLKKKPTLPIQQQQLSADLQQGRDIHEPLSPPRLA